MCVNCIGWCGQGEQVHIVQPTTGAAYVVGQSTVLPDTHVSYLPTYVNSGVAIDNTAYVVSTDTYSAY